MVEIVVTGAVEAVGGGGRLAALDGLQAKESLLEHLDGPLDALGLEGGSLRLAWRARAKRLEVETVWRAPRKLTAKEAAALVDYTTGQWSDGVGESFGGELADAREIELDLLPEPDAVRVEQREIRGAAKPATGRAADGKAVLKAASAGDVAKLRALLDAGAPTETRNKWKQTPLLAAIVAGHADAAALLIERGADVHAAALDDVRPIHGAAMMGLATIVSALLARGARADLPSKSAVSDGPGMTPRQWAENRRHPAVVRLLDKALRR